MANMSVCLSVRDSSIVSKQGNTEGCSPHCRVVQCPYPGKIWLQRGRPPAKTAKLSTFSLITLEP